MARAYSTIPQQIIEVGPGKSATVDTYYNFKRLKSFEVQIIGEVEETKKVAASFRLDQTSYLVEGYPLVNLKGDTTHKIGQRGFVFDDFKGDIEEPIAEGKPVEIKCTGTADNFTVARFILYYEEKTS